MLPRIANFDDFDPLTLEPGSASSWCAPGEPLPAEPIWSSCQAARRRSPISRFCATGWDIDIAAHARRGGRVLGLCGGYQMLGRGLPIRKGRKGRPASRRALACSTSRPSDRRQEAWRGRGPSASPMRALRRLRNAYRPDERPGFACAVAAIRRRPAMARCRRMVASRAPMSMGFSATTAARRLARTLGARSDLAYEAAIEGTLDDLAAHLERISTWTAAQPAR